MHSEAYPVFLQQQACLHADLRSIAKAAPGLTSGELERRFTSLESSTLQFVDRWNSSPLTPTPTLTLTPTLALTQVRKHHRRQNPDTKIERRSEDAHLSA